MENTLVIMTNLINPETLHGWAVRRHVIHHMERDRIKYLDLAQYYQRSEIPNRAKLVTFS